MNKKNTAEPITRFENLLVGIDVSPWDAMYRAAIGFMIQPAASRIWGERPPAWAAIPVLLGILLTLRVIPAVFRRLLPFSPEVRAIWAERRQIAKRYDSYQWRKLFWFGVGLMVYTQVASRVPMSSATLSAACLLAGALGLARWRAAAPMINRKKPRIQPN